jgi:hypothetical protein
MTHPDPMARNNATNNAIEHTNALLQQLAYLPRGAEAHGHTEHATQIQTAIDQLHTLLDLLVHILP